jgi:hypothetical protein
VPAPYNEVLRTIADRRALANDQQRAVLGAPDIYAAHFGTRNEARALRGGHRAVNFLLQHGRDGPFSDAVRTSLVQALQAVSPRFRLALDFHHRMDGFLLERACAVGAASGWPSSPGGSVVSTVDLAAQLRQELTMVWPERLVTERAALRYSRKLDKPTLQVLSGPLGEAMVVLKTRELEYLPRLTSLSCQPQGAADVPLTAAEDTRLLDIIAYRSAAGFDLDAGYLARLARRPGALRSVHLRAARLWLQMHDGIDVLALYHFFASPCGRKFLRRTRRLDVKHGQDIAAAFAAAQRQAGNTRELGTP